MKKKILLIDDNEEFKDMLCEYLKMYGFEILSAENGDKGINLAIENIPDLIFLDVSMPSKTGIEVLKELQNNESTKDIPVIVITGTHFDTDTLSIYKKEKNMKCFMHKNIELDMIGEKVKELIGFN
jgi:CheY-like chemotaxis protein